MTEIPMLVDWPATWSKKELFDTCPWKFWLQEGSKFVTGKADIPFVTNRAMELGNAKHALYETALKLHVAEQPLHQSIIDSPLWSEHVFNIVKDMYNLFPNAIIEDKIGIDNHWGTWSLGKYWNPDQAAFGNKKMFLRAKMDLMLLNDRYNPYEIVILDYKSGKVRKPKELGQLAMYALIAFLKWPSVQSIYSAYIFIDHNDFHDEQYLRSDIPRLKEYFVSSIMKIHEYLKAAQQQVPYGTATPGNCHWCSATQQQCEDRR